jgi:hypothetical protein
MMSAATRRAANPGASADGAKVDGGIKVLRISEDGYAGERIDIERISQI